eukprot:2648981-Pyramimonas_sp.AAC.1
MRHRSEIAPGGKCEVDLRAPTPCACKNCDAMGECLQQKNQTRSRSRRHRRDRDAAGDKA